MGAVYRASDTRLNREKGRPWSIPAFRADNFQRPRTSPSTAGFRL
jgi:hypothetical protein